MKNNFTETMLVAMLPYLMVIADVKDILIIIAASLSSIWVLIQIIDKLRSWNKKESSNP